MKKISTTFSMSYSLWIVHKSDEKIKLISGRSLGILNNTVKTKKLKQCITDIELSTQVNITRYQTQKQIQVYLRI